MPRVVRLTVVLLALAVPSLARAQAPASGASPAGPAVPRVTVAPGDYALDVAHTQVTFKVRHLGISTVTGRFTRFAGVFAYDSANAALAKVDVEIDPASVDTDVERRDAHLRSQDFFWVEKYPTMSFRSRTINRVGATTYRVLGDLTIRGVTKPVVLDAEVSGVLRLASGASIAALTATTTINRFDYGLAWNRVTEGVAMVAPEVEIVLNVEAKRAAPVESEAP